MNRFLTTLPMMGLLVVALLTSNCQQHNNPEESFSESDILKAAVTYINYNFNKESRLTGVPKLTLESTRALDNSYYGYDASPDTLLWGVPGLEKSDCILENDEKELSIYLLLSEPSPETSIGITFPVFVPFADGTFPNQKTDRFIARTVRVTGRTVNTYDSANNEYQGLPYVKWTVLYDNQEIPQQWDQECTNAATGELTNGCDFGLSISSQNQTIARKTVTFGADPRTYSDYYVTGYTFFDISSNMLAQLRFLRTGNEDNHAHTSACYASDGVTLTTDFCGLSDATVNSAAKTVETFILSDTSASTGAKQYQIIKKYYNGNDVEFYRLTKTYTFLNERTFQITSYNESEHSVDSAGNTTMAKNNASTHNNSFLTEKTLELYSAGTLTSSTMHQYERDAQGRISDYLVKDASGDSILHAVYTFDSEGWLNRIRSYDFSGSTQNETPICGENFDFDYSKDVYGNTAKTTTNYCNGTTYQTTPHEIRTKTYNSKGLLTSDKLYKISGSNVYISSRIDYEYDDFGFNSKIQYYEGEASSMQAASYTIRERDDNIFLTAEKIYNSDGDLITNPGDATSDCVVNSSCYSVVSYTYK